MARRWIAALLLAPAASCIGSADAPAGSARVDTLGGTVHVWSPPVSPDSAELVLRIGSLDDPVAEGPHVFGRVPSVTMDAAGTIYVADQNANEVRLFSGDGTFLGTIGRPGEGPGEFGDLYSLGWIGDTLAVLDPGNARISLFTPEGTSVGQRRWLALTGPSRLIRLFSFGAGEVYAPYPTFGEDNAQRVFLRFRAGVLEPDTMRHAFIESDEPSGSLCRVAGGGISFFSNPFVQSVIVVPGPDASIAAAGQRQAGVVQVGAAGDTTRVISVRDEPGPVPADAWAEVASDFAEYRQEYPDAECEPEDLHRPDALPNVDGIFFSREGTLVVERMRVDGTRFDFFTEDGILEQRVDLPERDDRVAPFFGGRRIVVVEQGAFDVQTVALYER